MTGIWLRIGLIVALIGSLFVGVWDFFRNPTTETAVAAVVPTVEKVERARAITEPVVQFVSEQDEESVAALVEQAELEFDASLSQPGAPVELVNEVRAVAAAVKARTGTAELAPLQDPTTQTEPSEPSGTAAVAPGTQPGIEWYRKR